MSDSDLSLRVAARHKAATTSPVDSAKKRGEWNLLIYHSRRTRWDVFMENPQGGGGGSSSYSSVNAAIKAGLTGIDWPMYGKGKTKVWCILAEWNPELEQYDVKKASWVNIPADLLEREPVVPTKEDLWRTRTLA
jgi:hypothetical protein